MRIDDNLEVSKTGVVSCIHCATALGNSADAPLQHAIWRELPSLAAGTGVRADPARFTDRLIVLRQMFCPGCFALLDTEIVPDDERSYRSWTLEI